MLALLRPRVYESRSERSHDLRLGALAMGVILVVAVLVGFTGYSGWGPGAIALFFLIHGLLRRWVALGGAALLVGVVAIWFALAIIVWSMAGG